MIGRLTRRGDRSSGAKTPHQVASVVTRPTSAVKPHNISSKVDSGLARAGPGRVPVVRHQRSHSAGPARKNSLQHRQVETLRASTTASSQAASPQLSRKQQQQQVSAMADDEASDTENETRWVLLLQSVFFLHLISKKVSKYLYPISYLHSSFKTQLSQNEKYGGGTKVPNPEI